MTGPRGYLVEGTVTLRISVSEVVYSTDPTMDAVTQTFEAITRMDPDELRQALELWFYEDDLSCEPYDIDGPDYD